MPCRPGSSRPVRRSADGPSQGGVGAAGSEGRVAIPRRAFGPGRESVGSQMVGVEQAVPEPSGRSGPLAFSRFGFKATPGPEDSSGPHASLRCARTIYAGRLFLVIYVA